MSLFALSPAPPHKKAGLLAVGTAGAPAVLSTMLGPGGNSAQYVVMDVLYICVRDIFTGGTHILPALVPSGSGPNMATIPSNTCTWASDQTHFSLPCLISLSTYPDVT